MSELSSAKKFQFIGGNLALDFCNTVGGKRGVVEREYLGTALNYIGWCHQTGVLSAAQAEESLARAAREPAEAEAAIARAIQLREAIFRIFDPRRTEGCPAAGDLEVLNAELSRALCRLRLAPLEVPAATEARDEGPGERHASITRPCTWRWEMEAGALDQPLGPVAHAAATLLTDPHALAHVRMCNGDDCGWLFIDSSRNHSRCWCDMRDCGNRAKIRRHRLKHRKEV